MSTPQHEQSKPTSANPVWTVKGMLVFITWCYIAGLILGLVAVIELVRMVDAVTSPF